MRTATMKTYRNWDDPGDDSTENVNSEGNGGNDYGNGYNNGFNGFQGWSMYQDPEGTNRKFANAAMTCGIISIVMLIWGGILALPFGALGIIFACLSRRFGNPLARKARRGMTFSIVGIAGGLMFTVYAVVMIVRAGGVVNYLNNEMKQIYGESFDAQDYLGINDYETFQDYMNQAQTYQK